VSNPWSTNASSHVFSVKSQATNVTCDVLSPAWRTALRLAKCVSGASTSERSEFLPSWGTPKPWCPNLPLESLPAAPEVHPSPPTPLSPLLPPLCALLGASLCMSPRLSLCASLLRVSQ